jgi:hypothetical protein
VTAGAKGPGLYPLSQHQAASFAQIRLAVVLAASRFSKPVMLGWNVSGCGFGDKVVYRRRLVNDLARIHEALAPYRVWVPKTRSW